MGFLVSPGVQVNEVDLTNVVPAVATSIGAIAGAFQKGPVSSVVNISSEEELVEIFGKPVTTGCLLYTSPSPRDLSTSRMPSSA